MKSQTTMSNVSIVKETTIKVEEEATRKLIV